MDYLFLILSLFFPRLVLLIYYTRYLHLKELIPNENKGLLMANRISVVIGFLSSFGITIVGNFQVKESNINYLIKLNIRKSIFFKETNVYSVHTLGAVMAFFGLLIYNWIQTILANKLSNALDTSRRIFIIRIIMCIIATINLIFSKAI